MQDSHYTVLLPDQRIMGWSTKPWQSTSKKGQFIPVRIEPNLLVLCQYLLQLFPRNFTIHTCRYSTLGYVLTCNIIKTFTRPAKLLPLAPIYLFFQFFPEKVQELLFVLEKESIRHAFVGAKMPEGQLYHGAELGTLCQGTSPAIRGGCAAVKSIPMLHLSFVMENWSTAGCSQQWSEHLNHAYSKLREQPELPCFQGFGNMWGQDKTARAQSILKHSTLGIANSLRC